MVLAASDMVIDPALVFERATISGLRKLPLRKEPSVFPTLKLEEEAQR